MEIAQILEIPLNKKIMSILKLPKGFLALMNDQTIRLYIEDND